MADRRVMIVIDPPEPGDACFVADGFGGYIECRHSSCMGYCSAGFKRDPHRRRRPADCIAAEAQVEALQGGIIARVQEIADGLWPEGPTKRDRVAETLAAVCGEPQLTGASDGRSASSTASPASSCALTSPDTERA